MKVIFQSAKLFPNRVTEDLLLNLHLSHHLWDMRKLSQISINLFPYSVVEIKASRVISHFYQLKRMTYLYAYV